MFYYSINILYHWFHFLVKLKKILAPSTHILQRDVDWEDFDESCFHYWSIIGKLNYLEKGACPDIAYTTHQLAHFSSNPKLSHRDAVIWLAKYLKATCEHGFLMDQSAKGGLEVHTDADFVGNWHKAVPIGETFRLKNII